MVQDTPLLDNFVLTLSDDEEVMVWSEEKIAKHNADVKMNRLDEAIFDKVTSAPTANYSSLLEQLPRGWMEAVDPESTNTYYSNLGNGVSLWKRPITMDTTDGPPESEENSSAEKSAEETDMVGTEPAKESTNTNRYSEECTQLDHPVTEEIIEDVDHRFTEDDNQTLVPGNLQDGWLEATDPSSGKSSYYNKVTGANE